MRREIGMGGTKEARTRSREEGKAQTLIMRFDQGEAPTDVGTLKTSENRGRLEGVLIRLGMGCRFAFFVFAVEGARRCS